MIKRRNAIPESHKAALRDQRYRNPQPNTQLQQCFQSRGGIKRPRSKHGEAQSLSEDAAGSLSADAAAEMIEIPVPRDLVLSMLSLRDIFNCDETGLCWKMPPDQRLPTVSSRKKEKTRICALFCCNSDASERLPIWFIGCARRPRAFTAAGINPENLGCKWRSNTKASMGGDIFKEWLLWFDQRMGGRKVALLLDNLSIHKAAYVEIGEQLQNTLVIWLPGHSTSRFQPLDQGIVRMWKAYWKREWILYVMAEFDRGFNPISTMTILQALWWAIPAWNIDVKDDIIRQCFKNALTIEDIHEIDNDEIELMDEIQQGIQKLELSNHIQEAMSIRQFLDPADEHVNDDFVDLDDNLISQLHPENRASDDDDDAWEALPQISPAEGLECLYKLRLFEEQQVDADQRLIQHLMRHERVLLRKKIEKEQQSHVRMF
ncbi:hypothetical protein CNMCM6106_003299 [Aspergillus hiratsukae]|uniref:DDE-1 domain-containing protein n=1 Tax=Aspergillus hiratsukae TaxID=1194566 RepID=A0A8H6UVW3_9EURO|nr:hypothetical protein CNMCM6106_003299 [Aspergillus hiratsukae]